MRLAPNNGANLLITTNIPGHSFHPKSFAKSLQLIFSVPLELFQAISTTRAIRQVIFPVKCSDKLVKRLKEVNSRRLALPRGSSLI